MAAVHVSLLGPWYTRACTACTRTRHEAKARVGAGTYLRCKIQGINPCIPDCNAWDVPILAQLQSGAYSETTHFHAAAGKFILSSSLDSKIRLWNFEKGKAVKRYEVRVNNFH